MLYLKPSQRFYAKVVSKLSIVRRNKLTIKVVYGSNVILELEVDLSKIRLGRGTVEIREVRKTGYWPESRSTPSIEASASAVFTKAKRLTVKAKYTSLDNTPIAFIGTVASDKATFSFSNKISDTITLTDMNNDGNVDFALCTVESGDIEATMTATADTVSEMGAGTIAIQPLVVRTGKLIVEVDGQKIHEEDIMIEPQYQFIRPLVYNALLKHGQ